MCVYGGSLIHVSLGSSLRKEDTTAWGWDGLGEVGVPLPVEWGRYVGWDSPTLHRRHTVLLGHDCQSHAPRADFHGRAHRHQGTALASPLRPSLGLYPALDAGPTVGTRCECWASTARVGWVRGLHFPPAGTLHVRRAVVVDGWRRILIRYP